MAGEAFAIAIMVIATGVGIAFIDFIQRNACEALGIERFRPQATGDGTGLEMYLPTEARAAARNRAGGGAVASDSRHARTSEIAPHGERS